VGRFRGGKPEKGRYLTSDPPPQRSDSEQHPTFCLRHVIADPHFSLEDLDRDNKVALIEKLRRLSQMTWAQINSADRHGMGYEKIAQNSLRFPLPRHITADVRIIAFRYNGMSPMLGYRDQATFHIICIDPNFRAYQH
jgi:hypothetical protein